MSELKKCPFCGGDAEICKNHLGVQVSCRLCLSATDVCNESIEAESLWNNRWVKPADIPAYVGRADLAQPSHTDYEALEREHFGDSEKKTGIYHHDNCKPSPQQGAQDDGIELLRREWKVIDGDCREPDGLITYHVSAFDEGYRTGLQARAAMQQPKVEWTDGEIIAEAGAMGIAETNYVDMYSAHKGNLIDFARAILAGKESK